MSLISPRVLEHSTATFLDTSFVITNWAQWTPPWMIKSTV
jgi:hypothetical protein